MTTQHNALNAQQPHDIFAQIDAVVAAYHHYENEKERLAQCYLTRYVLAYRYSLSPARHFNLRTTPVRLLPVYGNTWAIRPVRSHPWPIYEESTFHGVWGTYPASRQSVYEDFTFHATWGLYLKAYAAHLWVVFYERLRGLHSNAVKAVETNAVYMTNDVRERYLARVVEKIDEAAALHRARPVSHVLSYKHGVWFVSHELNYDHTMYQMLHGLRRRVVRLQNLPDFVPVEAESKPAPAHAAEPTLPPPPARVTEGAQEPAFTQHAAWHWLRTAMLENNKESAVSELAEAISVVIKCGTPTMRKRLIGPSSVAAKEFIEHSLYLLYRTYSKGKGKSKNVRKSWCALLPLCFVAFEKDDVDILGTNFHKKRGYQAHVKAVDLWHRQNS
jgi:hypothetical protein